MTTCFRISLAVLLALTCCARASAQDIQIKAPAPADEQLDAQAQQYVQMMQPAMWRELDFVRQTCPLAPAQRPKIKAAGDAGVKQAARDMIRPRRGGQSQSTAGRTIREEIAKVLKTTLTAQQFATYEAEEAKRRAADKHAAITSAVAIIDGALYLTKEQRDKIVQALEAQWKEDWEQWLQMWQYAGQYYPQVPDQFVTPVLNDEQKTVWRGLQKVSFNPWGGDFGERAANDDAWWAGQAPAGKAKAKAKAETP